MENKPVRFVSDAGGTVWDTLFTLRPVGDGTELEIKMDARAYKLLPKFMIPLIVKRMVRKGMEKHLDSLRARCEAVPGAR